MSVIDQVDIDELADGGAPLDEQDIQALLDGTAGCGCGDAPGRQRWSMESWAPFGWAAPCT